MEHDEAVVQMQQMEQIVEEAFRRISELEISTDLPAGV